MEIIKIKKCKDKVDLMVIKIKRLKPTRLLD
jgi:hypothetical protein